MVFPVVLVVFGWLLGGFSKNHFRQKEESGFSQPWFSVISGTRSITAVNCVQFQSCSSIAHRTVTTYRVWSVGTKDSCNALSRTPSRPTVIQQCNGRGGGVSCEVRRMTYPGVQYNERRCTCILMLLQVSSYIYT